MEITQPNLSSAIWTDTKTIKSFPAVCLGSRQNVQSKLFIAQITSLSKDRREKRCVLLLSSAFGSLSKAPESLDFFVFGTAASSFLFRLAVNAYVLVCCAGLFGAHLQPAPRARLLSLCTLTLESFRVSLSMALRRPGYSDWSIGYMPEGHETKRQSAHQGSGITARLLGKLWLHLMFLWWNTRAEELGVT